MSIDSSSPTRRKFLANSALATSAALLASGGVFNFLAPNQAAASNGSIRPFRVMLFQHVSNHLTAFLRQVPGGASRISPGFAPFLSISLQIGRESCREKV